jgi:hypothetical protein
MKFSHLLILLITVYSTGCATSKDSIENSRKIASIKHSFTSAQLDLDACMQSTNSKCSLSDLSCQQDAAVSCSAVVLGPEEAQRISVQSNELVQDNIDFSNYSWLLLNPSKISKTIKFIKKLNSVYKKIKGAGLDSMHGQGVGVFSSAYLVEGRNFHLESMIFNREMNLYCAPGMQYSTDIGVQAGFTKSIALGCKDNSAYEGQFVSLGAGVSFSNFGIPFAIDAAYSFGLRIKVFKKHLKEASINSESLLDEFKQLQLLLPQYISSAGLSEVQSRSLKLSLIIATSSLGEIDFSKSLADDVKSSEFDLSGVNPQYSLGKIAKNILTSTELNDFLDNYNFENTKKVLSSLNSALTGCDSVSGSISAELSAMPVNITVASSLFKKLLTVDIEKVTSLKNLSAFMLLNPIFMDRYTFSKVIEIALLVDQFPEIIKNKCYSEDYHEMTKTLSLGHYLMK